MSKATSTSPNKRSHVWWEDYLAILVAGLMMALAVILFQAAHLFTGGIVGATFLIHYASGWAFSELFILLNIPFYILGYLRFGAQFCFKTLLAVLWMSLLVKILPSALNITAFNPYVTGVLAGILAGNSMLILFRHQSSFGGFSILVLYLQDCLRLNIGATQLAIDLLILLIACAVMRDQHLIVASIISGVLVNLTLLLNHRPGRYISF